MGCVSDKPVPGTKFLPPYLGHSANSHMSFSSLSLVQQEQEYEQTSLLNTKIAESIKKRDIILFHKAIQQYQVKPNDFVGPSNQLKTVLHKIAEHNFSQGMALLLEELSAQGYPQLSKVVNMRDSDGNTPLILCCLFNAVETLEVLAKNEHVDLEAKNLAKKTAIEIALEMESPCSHILNSIASANTVATKNTLKNADEEAFQQMKSIEEEGAKSDPKEFIVNSTGFDTRTSLDERKTSIHCAEDFHIVRNLLKNSYNNQNLFYHVLSDLESNNANFKDSEFPHETYYVEHENYVGDLLRKYPQFTWSRPSEFFNPISRQHTVFDNFLCNIAKKTPLGGCEIYSALASLAEYPQRLAKIFNTKEVNNHGVYSLNLTIAGTVIEVLLDDYFPSTDGTHLLYSQPASGELWFSLLEKAFAKLHGGYAGLGSVSIVDALETLTGMPVAQKTLKEVEEDTLWGKLLDYDKKNYIMCAGETKRYHNGSRNRNFTIVGITEINNIKLIKMRNHFGDFSWQGDYSKYSSLWTQDLKEKVGFCDFDNSCFYMQLKDFMREFDSLTVCHYHDNWSKNTIETMCAPNHPVYFEIDIQKETETYICVHQRSPQFVDEDAAYNISPVELILARRSLHDEGLESIATGEREAFLGKPTVYVHDTHRVKLHPGKYVLYVKIRWTDGLNHNFMLNMLSSVAPKVSQADQQIYSNFLERVYAQAGLSSREKFSFGNDCALSSGWAGSHLWVCGHNKSKKTWTLEVTFQKMRNLKLGKKCRERQNVLKLVVPPGQKVAAYAKRASPAAVSVAWDFKNIWN